jgi:cytochrome P450
MPPQKIKSLTDPKDKNTSFPLSIADELEARIAFPSAVPLQTHYDTQVIHHYLPSRLPGLVQSIWEEISFCIDRNWGMGMEEWKEIEVCGSVREMILAVITRFWFDERQICRDEDFKKAFLEFAGDVNTCIIFGGWIPKWLRPILGRWVLGLPNMRHAYRVRKYVLPIIEKRLAAFGKAPEAGSDMGAPIPAPREGVPDDLLTWFIQHSLAKSQHHELEPSNIFSTFLSTEYGWVTAITLTASNLLLDVFSSNAANQVPETILEEIQTSYDNCGRIWTKQTLDELLKTESAIRESLRLSLPRAIGHTRKVTAKDGIVVHEGERGWVAPKGVVLVSDVWGVHHDPEKFVDPMGYNAFRFVGEDETHCKNQKPARKRFNGEDTRNNEALGAPTKVQRRVTSANEFGVFTFGDGRHLWYALPSVPTMSMSWH